MASGREPTDTAEWDRIYPVENTAAGARLIELLMTVEELRTDRDARRGLHSRRGTLVVVTVRIYEKLKRRMQRIDDACAGYELDPVAPAA